MGTMKNKTKRSERESIRTAHEMEIIKYREFARGAPDERTRQRLEGLIAELENKLREIDR
jgi:hypothetical protein